MIKEQDLKIFSLIWSAIFTLVGFTPLLHNQSIRFWAVAIALLFIVIAVIKPQVLTRFYLLWMKFGEFMGGIISKMVLFILYFALFTPISLFLKLIGKDLLNKKIDKSQESYWIKRERQPESMKNQF
jgi:hypothetical protein